MADWQKIASELGPLNRVHAGNEMQKAFRLLKSHYPQAELMSVVSGERAGTWECPPEWVVDEAVLRGPDGKIIANFKDNPLHVFAYSPPFEGEVSLEELNAHLLSVPEKPDSIPLHFRNQYRFWNPQWGFCISDRVRKSLAPGKYFVSIKTELKPGKMEMATEAIEGEFSETLLLVGHFDHPATLNDGLMGCLAGHEVLKQLHKRKTKLSYRMLSTVEIVGSAFYVDRWVRDHKVSEATFLATAGARASYVYQNSFRERGQLDRIFRHLLAFENDSSSVVPFRTAPLGNDEIAFEVPGVSIPCGVLMRAPYAEYHSHLDNMDAVDIEKFESFVRLVLNAIDILERNSTLRPKFQGLPQLSNPALNLYVSPVMVSNSETSPLNEWSNLLNSLHHSSGAFDIIKKHPQRLNDLMTLVTPFARDELSTLELAEEVGLPFQLVDAYTELWVKKGLIEKVWLHPWRK